MESIPQPDPSNPVPPSHIILSTMGTDGDVFPYIGLGIELRKRGHRVTLVASANYADAAQKNGLEFRALLSAADMHRLLSDPDFWHPIKGGAVGARFGVPFIPRQYEMFAELAADPRSVFVSSPAIFAARLVQEKFGRPLASVLLQPWMIPSMSAPPVMPAKLSLPAWAPWPTGYFYYWMLDAIGHLLIGRDLNKFRKSLELPPVRVFRWWLSPQLVVGLFPDWWGPPQADWPKQIRTTDFLTFDGQADAELPAEVEQFVQAGEPPVVFTFGTGMMHASDMYQACIEATGILGIRAIIATKHRQQIPPALPPSVLHVPYAPFGKLFPRCSAVVHHGGMGTIARTLSAGIPQLVLPIAWDQFENATKIKRLGVGDWLGARRRKPHDIAEALRAMMSPAVGRRAIGFKQRASRNDGLDLAANLVEDLASKRAT